MGRNEGNEGEGMRGGEGMSVHLLAISGITYGNQRTNLLALISTFN